MDKKIVILLIAATVLLVGGGTVYLAGSSSRATTQVSQNAKAETGEKEFNFGKIAYSGGNVEKTFTVKNSGTDNLKILNVRTSCHCTKAQVLTAGASPSPYFGMDSVSSWIGEVAPGKEAKIRLIFDPSYHGPQGVGPIDRYVALETNDPNNSKLTFSISGVVEK